MTFTCDGEPVAAEGGQSIAAALVAAGKPGGVFCAIGICFGCLVGVNGGPPVRACLAPAQDGDVVRRAR